MRIRMRGRMRRLRMRMWMRMCRVPISSISLMSTVTPISAIAAMRTRRIRRVHGGMCVPRITRITAWRRRSAAPCPISRARRAGLTLPLRLRPRTSRQAQRRSGGIRGVSTAFGPDQCARRESRVSSAHRCARAARSILSAARLGLRDGRCRRGRVDHINANLGTGNGAIPRAGSTGREVPRLGLPGG